MFNLKNKVVNIKLLIKKTNNNLYIKIYFK